MTHRCPICGRFTPYPRTVYQRCVGIRTLYEVTHCTHCGTITEQLSKTRTSPHRKSPDFIWGESVYDGNVEVDDGDRMLNYFAIEKHYQARRGGYWLKSTRKTHLKRSND